MCGIFGYMGERPDAATLVLSGLKRLDYRGYDAWGVAVKDAVRDAVRDHGHVVIEKRIGKIAEHGTDLPASHMALGHIRWATRGNGSLSDDNAHPQLDCCARLAVVHEGSVSNEAQLRQALVRAGHRLRSQTDSELIAHLIEDLLEQIPEGRDRLVQATTAAFRKLRGLDAITVLDVRRGEMVAAKNGSPLCVGVVDSGFVLASDHAAVLEHTQNICFVRDGQAVSIRRDGFVVYDMSNGQELTAELTQIDDLEARESHSHVMTRESILREREPAARQSLVQEAMERVRDGIVHDSSARDAALKNMLEQPALLRGLAERAPTYVRDLAAHIERAQDVFVIGCGSSGHAAHVAQYLFARAGQRVHSISGSEFSYLYPFLGSRSLVLALSQSGETSDVLDAVRTARERGANVAAITSVEGSTLWRSADLPLLLGDNTHDEQAPKSMSAQLALLLLTAHAMNDQLDVARNSLCQAADDIERLVGESARAEIQTIAAALQARDHLYVLGRGPNHAVALESALKIKEVSSIHAEGFAGGELKHGVMSLIEPHTPCIVFAPHDETQADSLANAMQVKARGGTLVGIAPATEPAFDHCIRVTDVGPATLITNTIPAQLLGHELARLRGRDAFMLRHLAKAPAERVSSAERAQRRLA
jgi:glucosamine--fructose-6-phosphate aminotransferase (isomerizing)